MQKLLHLLAGAILATTTPVQAFPSLGGLSPRDVFVPSTTCKDFVVGNDLKLYGQVCVGISDGMVTVTYPTLTSGTYSDIHVYIGTTMPTETSPGQLPYTLGNKACSLSTDKTSATCSIPIQDSWRACDLKLYIATHASLTAGTGWGLGPCYGKSTGNCAKYWTFNTKCQCPVVINYEPITSTTTCLTTITNIITSIVTPPPTSTITGCDDPNPGSPTSTITSTTTTSVDFTCPVYYPAAE
ncbi:hypothetical protein RAB80_017584 [Fusarium oxysporum f. sp. vasinfectum]|nr:hypothetical protein RAB80_017584 [Fusarium oxysporum f. sp. vasinfectum]KAK2922721.1 hypothetical protein FoTM2_017574 [Fusarium oxysporum f. sp. vasinfectum]